MKPFGSNLWFVIFVVEIKIDLILIFLIIQKWLTHKINHNLKWGFPSLLVNELWKSAVDSQRLESHVNFHLENITKLRGYVFSSCPTLTVGDVMHAGTYPAHHVHVGGGHVGVLLASCSVLAEVDCLHTCVSSQLLYTWTSLTALCLRAPSQHTQKASLKGLTMTLWGLQLLFINTSALLTCSALNRKTTHSPVCTFKPSHST